VTDRVKGCWVAFEKDVRDDDVQGLVDAILQLRGVSAVTTEKVKADDFIARSRVKRELTEKLIAVICPDEAERR